MSSLATDLIFFLLLFCMDMPDVECVGIVSRRLTRELSVKEMLRFRLQQILFDWQCCGCWQRFAHIIELFIMDAFVDLFITLCILLNTAFMAADHAGMSEHMARVLTIGNYVRTASPLFYSSRATFLT